MIDQCSHCTLRGDFDGCIKTECFHHESWISRQRKERYAELRNVAIALREWIDAVPEDTSLPTMPGIDRDFVDYVLDREEKKMTRQRRYQLRMKSEGRCETCGAYAVEGSIYCEEHLLKRRNAARARNDHNPWVKGGKGRPPLALAGR